jgi:hypothetical protein
VAAARVVVLGAGSVGCFICGAWQAKGLSVSFIGRPRIANAIAANGTTLGYTIDPPISGLDFDSANGIWTGTPDTPGTTTVAVSASNGTGTSRTCLVFRITDPAGSNPSSAITELGGGGCGAGVAGIAIAALGLLGLRRRD